jgi:ribose-phosphate pyrophosphokinase
MAGTLVVAGTNSEKFSKRLARRLKKKYHKLKVSHFPDGEMVVKYPVNVKGSKLIFVQSMYPCPDESLVQLLFAMGAAKEQGAKKVVLVIPYLGFMRQDKQFFPGQGISQHIMAKLLSGADLVVTMDPHLHRIKSLKQVFKTKTKKVTANSVIANHIKKKYKSAIVMGPDGESSQWAEAIAKEAKVPSVVLKKKRYTSEKVKIIVKTDIDLKGKRIVLVDDIISTGHTMIEPIKQLKKMKVKDITVIGVHGIFVKNALSKLKKLGVKVESTNTIENKASTIDASPEFAKVLK